MKSFKLIHPYRPIKDRGMVSGQRNSSVPVGWMVKVFGTGTSDEGDMISEKGDPVKVMAPNSSALV